MKSTPNLKRMTSRNVAQVVAHLVFVLIAQVGEKSDGSGELVVAESFESGDRQRGRTEGERQREAEIGVARLGKMQQAGAENQIAEPGRTESIGIADDRVPVVVVRDQVRWRAACPAPPARCG